VVHQPLHRKGGRQGGLKHTAAMSSLPNAPYAKDTIAAVATANGKGGIGVVRVSGPHARQVAKELLSKPIAPRQVVYCDFVDAQKLPIDTGIALFFQGPRSFTGEDVLELQGHGGPVVLNMLLRRVLALGVRAADAGEFTQRAFLNDKLDLAQAEAVADLIDAQTEQAVRLANRSLQGVFSQQIQTIVEQVIRLRMLVEATLDFPEEEIDFLEAADARGQLQTILDSMQQLLSRAAQGALLRSGLNVVLAGSPNVGKSSLLNALAGQEIAIVTPIAGTTRDKVVQAISIEGIALNIIDTAGLRETKDTVEQIGIERTWQEIESADLVLHLRAWDQALVHDETQQTIDSQLATVDADALLDSIRARLSQAQGRRTPIIQVMNKVDLSANQLPRIVTMFDEQNTAQIVVHCSARLGLGLDLLRQEILKCVGWQNTGDDLILARERQLVAMSKANEHTLFAQEHVGLGNSRLDLMAEELRLAQAQLSSITGQFTADDLLGEIFSRFCIGK
jgi:tRNA modification GTPase